MPAMPVVSYAYRTTPAAIATARSAKRTCAPPGWKTAAKICCPSPISTVYSKPPFGGPEQVLKYLARYTHRVAIANSRITAADADSVSFRYQDYAGGNRNRVLTLDAVEFLRRFLQHVLPDRFVRIRHYGFLANRARKQKLPLCLRLIAQATGQHVITAPDLQAVLDVPDDDHELCPACHAGTMGRIQE